METKYFRRSKSYPKINSLFKSAKKCFVDRGNAALRLQL